MSHSALETAFNIIDNKKYNAFITGGKSEEVIKNAEISIGTFFPNTFKEFIRKYGLVLIFGKEFSGIGKNETVESWARDTLYIRRNDGASSCYIVISLTGDGAYYALDTSRMNADNECPVVLLDYVHGEKPVDVAEDFGKFLLDQLQEALENHSS